MEEKENSVVEQEESSIQEESSSDTEPAVAAEKVTVEQNETSSTEVSGSDTDSAVAAEKVTVEQNETSSTEVSGLDTESTIAVKKTAKKKEKPPKRDGVFYNDRTPQELEAMQRKKSLFMYGSTLLLALVLFFEVEGRARLVENRSLTALATLYLLLQIALIAMSVYVSVMDRTGQRIAPSVKEKYMPRDGLDKHTFVSFELFNALHFVAAAAEIAVAAYKIGVWGVFSMLVSVGSAVCSLFARNILFKANAGHLTAGNKEE